MKNGNKMVTPGKKDIKTSVNICSTKIRKPLILLSFARGNVNLQEAKTDICNQQVVGSSPTNGSKSQNP